MPYTHIYSYMYVCLQHMYKNQQIRLNWKNFNKSSCYALSHPRSLFVSLTHSLSTFLCHSFSLALLFCCAANGKILNANTLSASHFALHSIRKFGICFVPNSRASARARVSCVLVSIRPVDPLSIKLQFSWHSTTQQKKKKILTCCRSVYIGCMLYKDCTYDCFWTCRVYTLDSCPDR